MKLYCDNKLTINIAHNLFQHDWTKHAEVDRHFIEKKLKSRLICTPYVPTHGQLVDILTKGLTSSSFQKVTSKLGMDDIYIHQLDGSIEEFMWFFDFRNQCTIVGILVK